MPKYGFKCPNCETSKQDLVPVDTRTIACPACESPMLRQLPILNGPSNVTEVINKETAIAWRVDQQEEVKQRRQEYYWSVEVPRFVASGTYAIDTMLENGWIWIDDDNHIQVNTKPPNQR